MIGAGGDARRINQTLYFLESCAETSGASAYIFDIVRFIDYDDVSFDVNVHRSANDRIDDVVIGAENYLWI